MRLTSSTALTAMLLLVSIAVSMSVRLPTHAHPHRPTHTPTQLPTQTPTPTPTPTPPASGISLDIHLQLENDTFELVVAYNNEIHQLAPNDQINLGKTSLPHITLYLTEFNQTFIPDIQREVQSIMNNLSAKALGCHIYCDEVVVSGQYGMWNIEINECLQYMSDLIINTTYKYIIPNQHIPDWVYELPEPLRSEKIAMIKTYGSPNVFSQFQPHITLAWDEVDNLNKTFDAMNIQPTEFISPSLGIGCVGNYGTVLNNEYGLFTFQQP